MYNTLSFFEFLKVQWWHISLHLGCKDSIWIRYIFSCVVVVVVVVAVAVAVVVAVAVAGCICLVWENRFGLRDIGILKVWFQ